MNGDHRDWRFVMFSSGSKLAIEPVEDSRTHGWPGVYRADAVSGPLVLIIYPLPDQINKASVVGTLNNAQATGDPLMVLFHKRHSQALADCVRDVTGKDLVEHDFDLDSTHDDLIRYIVRGAQTDTLTPDDVTIEAVFVASNRPGTSETVFGDQVKEDIPPMEDENLVSKLEEAWRADEFRRLLILCALFPDQPQIIELCYNGHRPADILANELNHHELFLVEKDRQAQYRLNERLQKLVEERVIKELCLPSTSTRRKRRSKAQSSFPTNLDDLRHRIQDMLADKNHLTYFEELVAAEDGFFGGGFVCGPNLTIRSDHDDKSRIYAARYDTWHIAVGSPLETASGRLDDKTVIENFFFAVSRIQGPIGVKILFSPAFLPPLMDMSGKRGIGIYLLDWLTLTYMRRFQIQHDDCIDSPERAFALFDRVSTGLWDYSRLEELFGTEIDSDASDS